MRAVPTAGPQERHSPRMNEIEAPTSELTQTTDGIGGGVQPEGESTTPSHRRYLGAGVVLGVVLCVAVGSLLLHQRANAARQDDAARAAVLNEVRAAVPDILGYDYARMGDDIDGAAAHLTPAFEAEYRALAESSIRPTAVKYKAIVVADLVSAGVESVDRSSAQVLIFVNQTTRTTALPAPRVDSSRVRVTLERSDGRWRVGSIEPL